MRGQGTHVQYKDVNWITLKRLIPYLLAYKKRIALAMSCLVAAKVASVGLPFILKYIVDHLDNKEGIIIALPLGLLLGYGVVRLANVLLSEIRDTIFGRVTEAAMRQVGLRVFEHLHSLDLAFHISRKTGGLSRDIERGTTGISFLLRFMIFNIVPTLLEIILIVVLLSSKYSIIFGLVILLAVVAYVAYSIYATEIRTRYVRQMNTADSNTNSRAVDSLLNYETVKYFNNEKYEAQNYDEELVLWQNARRKNRLSVFALNGGQAFIISTAMTVAMIIAAYEVTRENMTLGDFVLINTFMMQIFMPLNFLGFVYREMKGSMANIENMFSLLDTKRQILESPNASSLSHFEKKIEFSNISFNYDEQRTILNQCTFHIEKNQKLALVGASGSGKSTIGKLLFRFYDVNEGSILIDDIDIKDYKLSDLRQNMAVIPQDTMLFNASIYDNIKYGRLQASDNDIKKAIDQAYLSSFIDSLPEGWNTIVGERGLKLSGGEKQRIAIARAILKNPPIFIFDEATSSLDSQSEQEVLRAIEAISDSHTSLIIAHRLSTIAKADKIIVLHEGKIVEEGKHEELLNAKGRYEHLWSIQQNKKEQKTV